MQPYHCYDFLTDTLEEERSGHVCVFKEHKYRVRLETVKV